MLSLPIRTIIDVGEGFLVILPDFDENGLLPVGDYELTIEELKKSHLVTGSQNNKTWDMDWRIYLVNNLEIMVNQLLSCGISEIFIDGSFVEDKDHPNDIDGYFICDIKELASGALLMKLNQNSRHKIWTWDRSLTKFGKLPMWEQFHVELYPHFGQFCGIPDKNGNDQIFPSAFRTTRSGNQKGIIKLRSSS